jgi:uncharacterized membrane protein YuzA (DUF378 family)
MKKQGFEMKYLTKRIGRFPLGIWIVLLFLLVTGLVFTLFAQALSFFAWDTAFSLGLQEDSRTSADVVERAIGAMSWGEAGADVLVQGTLIILTLIGIFQQRPFGFVTGVALAIIWIYVALMIPLQRIGFYKWDVVPDLSRAAYVTPIALILIGIPGVVSLICLVANRDFFGCGRKE